MDGHPLIDIFLTLPLGCPSRICLIKTLQRKNPMEKNLSEGKKVQYLIICPIKNLTRKTQWDKTTVKGKRVQDIFISSPQSNNHL